jgi:outer membrane protein
MKKKILILVIVLTCAIGQTFTQRFAYVDSEYILNNIPAYRAAQQELNRLAEQWQKEIEAAYADIENKYKEYQAERVLLTEDMRRKKEEEIIEKEKQVKDLQRNYFGENGELFKRREELIKPVQDEVYNAIRDMATEGGFAIIFDTSAGSGILYSDPRNDRSDQILEKLGYRQ